MKRRHFIANALAAGAIGAFAPNHAPADPGPDTTPSDPEVKRVLVLFKCHLDVGFTNTQANVIKRYVEQHFPNAIETAAAMRQRGNDRYIWTTGSWLVYEYLEQAGAAERQRMEQAILAGDVVWHALPYTFQTEIMDPSLIAGALGFSRALDRRFRRVTTGAKLTDVPGHTRALIAPLVEGGVKFLDIGVNSASTPPDVPPVFQWKDPRGNSLVMMYHLRHYGGVVCIPGSDLAVDVEVRGDNRGPHTIEEIDKIYAGLRARFPNAVVTAASLSDIAGAVEPYRERLPVVTGEIGDTWIYGVPSDPVKIARYLEVARLRREWIGNRKMQPGDSTDLAFLRSFLLEAEHTWGTDTKTWLDFEHYTPADLARMLDQPKYKVVLSSWSEKRQDLFSGLAALPAPLRAQAESRVQALRPVEPQSGGWAKCPAGEIETRHYAIALDPKTGAITRLRNRKTGRDWASAKNPLAQFSYQTLSKADYDRFFAAYLLSKADWVPKDFGKPNIDRLGAVSRTWQPVIEECSRGRDAGAHRIRARLRIDDGEAQKAGLVAWPQKMYLELVLPDAEPVVDIRFSWFDKAANRMPEALWLTFQPAVADPRGWMLDKSGSPISPFDVVPGGNRTMHAILGGARYRGPEGTLRIESLDAPVAALGERQAVHFSRQQPDLAKGLHFSLLNNGWGTNYVQWFGEDMCFRFRISA